LAPALPSINRCVWARSKLRVSVAGLGGGGFSRLRLKTGKTEDEAARLILEAIDLGINFIDTAAAYAPRASSAASLQRDQVVISTKSTMRRDGASRCQYR
jgi:aryl-alcohol dehydrogenase-like predicted oxidoreductase